MQIVSLNAVASQTLSVQLGGQSVGLNIYQRATGLYMDVYVSGALIVGGVICQNLNLIVRDLYLGFSGDFMFYDNQGRSDPCYTGLGARYSLMYLATADLNGGG